MTRYFGDRLKPLMLAIVIIGSTSLPMYFLSESAKNFIYPLAAIQGVGLAIFLNTATSIISDVVGEDTESSAFVYGAYSFFDKFANGALLFWITSVYIKKEEPLRIIISMTPIFTSVIATILAYFGNKLYGHQNAKISKGSALKAQVQSNPQLIEELNSNVI